MGNLHVHGRMHYKGTTCLHLLYFIIAQVILVDAGAGNCRLTKRGREYDGNITQTRSGHPCQRWDSQSPHRNSWQDIDEFPDATLGDAANKCRNPSGSSEPWCYTTVTTPTWDYCDIPMCECKTNKMGKYYAGKLTSTNADILCQRWDSQTPHKHRNNDPRNFPEDTISEAANFCRNPDSEPGGPWCYTINQDIRWQYCDVRPCECKEDSVGQWYQGKKSVTTKGDTCQRWDSQSPHKHTRNNPNSFPEKNVTQAENYCRNPDREPRGPWCYTTKPDVRFDFCDVPFCFFQKKERPVPTPPPGQGIGEECRVTDTGKHFRGRISVTRSGLECQRWDSQSPHKHTYYEPEKFPDASVKAAHNYCRNPNEDGKGPWCYTTDPDIRWEYCTVPFCDCKDVKSGSDYTGNIRQTRNGASCQRWDSQYPHPHSDTDPDAFPDASLAEAADKCRNPGGRKAEPWCYTTDPNIIWEYCNVPQCDCKMTQKGQEYYGMDNITIDRISCQRWDQQYPHKHTRNDPNNFPEKDVSAASNYCRNPDGEPEGPWCYTLDPSVRWQYCDVVYCRNAITPAPTLNYTTTPTPFSNNDCKTTRQGTEYVGRKSVTISGKTCQRWDSQSPHKHPHNDPDKFPDVSLEEAANFCRNPDFSPYGPWCLTTDPSATWEYCDVSYCECKITTGGTEYTGTLSRTQSGKVCQRWDSQTPHKHPAFHPEEFPGSSVEGASNYCRNPKSLKEPYGPWCYTTDPMTPWEYCDLLLCECKKSGAGQEYIGQTSRTRTGRACQRWDSQYPHPHTNEPRNFPDKSISEASNYCRNPTGRLEGPWCYTTDSDMEWEYCDLPLCPGYTDTPRGPQTTPIIPQPQTGGKGLTTGGKVGIALGTILLVCAIVLASGFLVWKFRQNPPAGPPYGNFK